MRNDITDQKGLSSGRNWGAVPADDGAIEWSVDREGGLVQGPLDLGFMRGKRLFLALDDGQMALLVSDNKLQAVYLEGGHTLEIGNGPRQVPTSSGLVFLACDQAIQLRWTRLEPVTWKNRMQLEAIGHCSLIIDGPTRFYDTFLAATTAWDEQSVQRAVNETTRQAMATLLEDSFSQGQATEAEIQARLTSLDPEELSEILADSGLACVQIAAYTAAPPVEHESVEKAGQFSGLVHN